MKYVETNMVYLFPNTICPLAPQLRSLLLLLPIKVTPNENMIVQEAKSMSCCNLIYIS